MLNSIRVFLKVVETGSFSQAAAVLNMAPSSVARKIDALEKELHTALFVRSTRVLRLTEKGALFLEGAGRIVEEVDHLQAALRDTPGEPEGKLRISVFESFGRLHVCPLIPEFLKRYPGISLALELENQVVDLYSEDVDVSIRVGVLPDSQLKARPLLSNHTLVCATPGYLAAHGIPAHPDELASHNCLLLNRGRRQSYWYFANGRQQRKVPVCGNVTSKGGTPLLAALLGDCGIAQLSSWMVADYVRRGELVVLLDGWVPSLSENTSGHVYAMYKASAYPNPLIRLFIDFLVARTQNAVL